MSGALGASIRIASHWLCALSCLSFSVLRILTYKNKDNTHISLGGYKKVTHIVHPSWAPVQEGGRPRPPLVSLACGGGLQCLEAEHASRGLTVRVG